MRIWKPLHIPGCAIDLFQCWGSCFGLQLVNVTMDQLSSNNSLNVCMSLACCKHKIKHISPHYFEMEASMLALCLLQGKSSHGLLTVWCRLTCWDAGSCPCSKEHWLHHFLAAKCCAVVPVRSVEVFAGSLRDLQPQDCCWRLSGRQQSKLHRAFILKNAIFSSNRGQHSLI